MLRCRWDWEFHSQWLGQNVRHVTFKVTPEPADIACMNFEPRIAQIFRCIPIDILARRRKPRRLLYSSSRQRSHELVKRKAMCCCRVGQFGAGALFMLQRCLALSAMSKLRRILKTPTDNTMNRNPLR